MRAAEPRLEQRIGGREQEERQPDTGAEQHQDAPHRQAAVLRFPVGVRQNRIAPRAPEQRQQPERNRDQRKMQPALRGHGQMRRETVGIGVAREQQQLEEQHAGGPHRRRAAEPRQDALGEDQLHLEQQEGAEKNGDAVAQHGWAASGSRLGRAFRRGRPHARELDGGAARAQDLDRIAVHHQAGAGRGDVLEIF